MLNQSFEKATYHKTNFFLETKENYFHRKVLKIYQ